MNLKSENKVNFQDETPMVGQHVVIAEESTPALGETVEIDLKCAEKVTDSDVDDSEDTNKLLSAKNKVSKLFFKLKLTLNIEMKF